MTKYVKHRNVRESIRNSCNTLPTLARQLSNKGYESIKKEVWVPLWNNSFSLRGDTARNIHNVLNKERG